MDALHWVFVGIIGLLGLYLFIKDFQERQERRDLYNRLMAKDLRDYTAEQVEHEKMGSRNPVKKGIEEGRRKQQGE